VSGVALAAAAAALAVALTGNGSTEPTAASGSGTPVAAQGATVEPEPSTSEGAAAGSSAAEAVYAEAAAGVVEVNASGAAASGQAPFGGPGGGGGEALGTGFVVDDEGRIVTNEHVVEGADTVTVAFADGTQLLARVVGTDPSSDIALLQVDPSAVELHPLELGSSADLSVGQEVYALGNPFGLDRSLTSGIISALDRQIQAPNGYSISGTIQTDAAINSGNSGGPLLDADARVIGVTAQIESQTGGNVGIGYAIPIDLVEEVIGQLEGGGAVEHAYLGVSIEELTASLADSLGVEDGAGVYVAEVRDGSPAAEAGLEGGDSGQGDVIVSVDGQTVDSPEALTALISAKQPGDRVELEIVRDGEAMTVTATLGTRPESLEG
jgi:S1-C subfamily serine protease